MDSLPQNGILHDINRFARESKQIKRQHLFRCVRHRNAHCFQVVSFRSVSQLHSQALCETTLGPVWLTTVLQLTVSSPTVVGLKSPMNPGGLSIFSMFTQFNVSSSTTGSPLVRSTITYDYRCTLYTLYIL